MTLPVVPNSLLFTMNVGLFRFRKRAGASAVTLKPWPDAIQTEETGAGMPLGTEFAHAVAPYHDS